MVTHTNKNGLPGGKPTMLYVKHYTVAYPLGKKA